MNKQKNIPILVALSLAAMAGLSGCSDNSSANCGSCVDSGDTIEIKIPGEEDSGGKTEGNSGDSVTVRTETKTTFDSETDASSSSAKVEAAVSSAEEPASSDSKPASSEAASADWRDYCLEVVNAKRATENLPPLVRASEEREKCVESQAAADMAMNKGHGNFGDCGEFAQNTGPNVATSRYGTPEKIVDTYVKMMWDNEKKLVTSGERDPNKDSDYSYIGHYLNMKNTSYKSLACGIAYSEDGTKAWFNMNFY